MKKFITLIAAFLFFTMVPFASPRQSQPTQTNNAKSVKKPVKKTDKKEVKKVPHRTTTAKKAATKTTPSKPAPGNH